MQRGRESQQRLAGRLPGLHQEAALAPRCPVAGHAAAGEARPVGRWDSRGSKEKGLGSEPVMGAERYRRAREMCQRQAWPLVQRLFAYLTSFLHQGYCDHISFLSDSASL